MEIFILIVQVAALWVLTVGLVQERARRKEFHEECESCGECCEGWCKQIGVEKP